jgi:hypothetical protein
MQEREAAQQSCGPDQTSAPDSLQRGNRYQHHCLLLDSLGCTRTTGQQPLLIKHTHRYTVAAPKIHQASNTVCLRALAGTQTAQEPNNRPCGQMHAAEQHPANQQHPQPPYTSLRRQTGPCTHVQQCMRQRYAQNPLCSCVLGAASCNTPRVILVEVSSPHSFCTC